MGHTLENQVEWLKQMSSRLAALQSQDALLFLRHSFSTPSIQHLLRGIFCGDHQLLQELDEELRILLTRILNTELDEGAWQQVTLPVDAGGAWH